MHLHKEDMHVFPSALVSVFSFHYPCTGGDSWWWSSTLLAAMQIDNSHNLLVTSQTVPDVLIKDAKTHDRLIMIVNMRMALQQENPLIIKDAKHPWPLKSDSEYENEAVKKNMKSCSKHTHRVMLKKKNSSPASQWLVKSEQHCLNFTQSASQLHHRPLLNVSPQRPLHEFSVAQQTRQHRKHLQQNGHNFLVFT